MINAKYAVMQAAELLALPVGPQGQPGSRLLDEFLRNPFIDDDLLGLALRTGRSRAETEDCLTILCRERILKKAGRQGYLLDLEEFGSPCPTAGFFKKADLDKGAEDELAIESGRLNRRPVFGLILMRADGQPELVDQLAATWLEVPPEKLDATVFARQTGIDPTCQLREARSVALSLSRPCRLELAIYACRLGCDPGMFMVLRKARVDGENEMAQANIGKQLSGRLQNEVVEPLRRIRHFLENPNARELSLARTALDQVDQFLECFLLKGQKPDVDEPLSAN